MSRGGLARVRRHLGRRGTGFLVLLGPILALATALAVGTPVAAGSVKVVPPTISYASGPRIADANGNGVPDSAEDPDGDGLSNAAEARLGTSPTNPDTNGNGIPDGLEDANGNGITNAAEQDRRRVPARLRPSLSAAASDTPISYRNGCHTGPNSSTIHPCTYGAPDGHVTVALFGDSHGLQWVPALIKSGLANGWRIVVITKSGCASADIRYQPVAFPQDAGPCARWRQRGEVWLRSHVPDLIIIANSKGYILLDDKGQRVRFRDRETYWRRGLDATLAAMPKAAKVLVLGDTPHLDRDPAICLPAHRNNISACETPRDRALDPTHDATERAAAVAAGATFASLDTDVCTYDPCPVIVDDLMMWRNQSHLTATFVEQLSPSVANVIRDALRGPQAAESILEMILGHHLCLFGLFFC